MSIARIKYKYSQIVQLSDFIGLAASTPCPYTHLTVFNILVTLVDLKPVDSGRVDVAFDISRQKSESVSQT